MAIEPNPELDQEADDAAQRQIRRPPRSAAHGTALREASTAILIRSSSGPACAMPDGIRRPAPAGNPFTGRKGA